MLFRLLFFIFLFNVQFVAMGQSIELGLRNGFGFSNPFNSEGTFVKDFEETSINDLFGSVGGANVNFSFYYNINKKFAVGLEPGWIIKGHKHNYIDLELTHIFLQVPIAFKFNITERFHIVPNYEFAHHLKAISDDGNVRTDLKKIGLYDNGLEHSLGLSLGYRWSKRIDFGIKYSRGLNSIDSSSFFNSEMNYEYRWNEKTQYFHCYFIFNFYNSSSSMDTN